MMLRDRILEVLSVTPLKKKKLEEIVGHKDLAQLLFHFKKKGYVTSEKGVYSFVKRPKKYVYKQVRIKTEVEYGC